MDHNVTNTHTMVSDIHHIIVKNQEGANSKTVLVSVVCTLFITE